MLNIESIKSGLVIDHIRAGSGAKIFSWLGLDKAEYSVALIMNVPSKAMGKKDIIKIDNIINIDYSVLGFIDPNITVNVIKNEQIAEKITLSLPEKVENVIKCKNPRCITTTENYVSQIFHLVDKEKGQYRCGYCDELTSSRNF
ncbi:MAG: aspartate carbamoyltransferase regulatory subunit [Spirochaetaceae bacterium]|nr:aspartate carbamoyltransferase regulatory subunit [Spirochaetaceae bacterium]MBQ4553620.1 aspartate carbamoyltransferase regulatory subunit [Spirochaetaceae bacterium]MBQ8353050.1 aspartate carbamoyltransferase regulatory subunit [Spirochaetaceae bacterium]MBR4011787.1 aspartate carbamoyltransferase regulatory subunit [Spirochaetaceae bacterium]